MIRGGRPDDDVASGGGGIDTVELADTEDPSTRYGGAGDARDLHVPFVRGRGQFGLHTGAFREQAYPARLEKRRGKPKQIRQWGKRTGRHQWCGRDVRSFDSHGVDRHRSFHDPGRLPQKGRLALIALYEIEWNPGCRREDQTGKSGARTEIDTAPRVRGNMRHKLERVRNVTIADTPQIAPGHKIDRPVPAREQRDISVDRLLRFTWNIVRRRTLLHVKRGSVARRRTWAARAARAAGVMP